MAYEFRLQDPGEGIHEAEIIELKVSKGSHVKEGDDVLVAETDKAAVDIPTPVSGEVIEIRVSEGDIVEVGDVLMVIEEEGAEAAEDDEKASETQDGDEKEQDRERDEARDEARDEEEDQDEKEDHGDKAQDEGRDRQTTGKSKAAEAEPEAGRNKRKSEPKDAQEKETDAGASEEEKDEDRGKAEAGSEKTQRPEDGDVQATPAVRGLARELGVKLDEVTGSGEDGRILEEDVRKAAEGAQSREGKQAPAEDGVSERVKLRSLRRSTARRMTKAWREIPHVTHHDAIDITEIERMRRKHAADAEESGIKLTLTPFLMKALAGALVEHPRFNARFDAENQEIELVRAVNVGVALDTDRGLIVPVLRDVRRKTLLDLAEELTGISRQLGEDRASPEMLKGGTITLTNVGSIGGTGFTPIINPPQVAIFGAGRAELRQVLEGDIDRATAVTRLILPVCIAFDHRVNDGADAARFMNSVKLLMSDPQQFMLRS
ncbi:dihydrolipoamide acetyltransferase family protein [Roseibium salinum]|uniref:Dihydrolipoamide acetyltransferase component of pyruvate dehydrogenase complex n=1 Tax=Roseibium salinum TaxID=1604349 RepID=A0ABT3R4G1_9HYPH|nr:dihydrolipoamide acetyltransferase family protein [Roseibium sp. DSM 29163]MCX2723941.1 dihydrolipoamide acetyltransferase family protein [Roseibium sp. DSM 29163]MDN3718252.1 dihydrolipoamide acetyltransferase family protein [Roseibium salinum]